MANNWKKIDDTYWMCFNFDVYLDFGVWKAAFIYGRPYKQDFKTPEQAMRYVDTFLKE